MPRMSSTANRKLFFVPTVANPSKPTVAELADEGALDISELVMAEGFTLGSTGEESVSEPSLNARGNDSTPGRKNYEGGMNFFRWTTEEEDKAWDTFTDAGIEGYLVQRLGKDFELPFVAGDKVQVYEVVTGNPMIQTPPVNGGSERFRQMFYPQSRGTDERAVVA